MLDQGCLLSLILQPPPNNTYFFDGANILQQNNISPPPCAGYGFQFSWQVTGNNQLPLQFFTTTQGVMDLVTQGLSGQGVGYCGTVLIQNLSNVPVTVDVRYIQADCSSVGLGAC